MTDLKTQILEMSRQNKTGSLSPWFDDRLDKLISGDMFGYDTVIFPPVEDLYLIGNEIIAKLKDYQLQTKTSTAVIGMSGGVDSALTAAFLRDAGWKVIGVTMPIHQNPEETDRGIEACKELGIQHLHIDLSDAYDNMVATVGEQWAEDSKEVRIRRGNIRARLRMITLYNLAATYRGLVASTDNYSELAMGFWTLHGDVGDLSPIQSLNKSWEVPMLARLWDVPESIWRAKPTDGLGVSSGDEAQFGFTYLELDIMLFSITKLIHDGLACDRMMNIGGVNKKNVLKALNIEVDPYAIQVFENLMQRMGGTWFKRLNPVNIKHPLDSTRYTELDGVDHDLFHPIVIK